MSSSGGGLFKCRGDSGDGAAGSTGSKEGRGWIKPCLKPLGVLWGKQEGVSPQFSSGGTERSPSPSWRTYPPPCREPWACLPPHHSVSQHPTALRDPPAHRRPLPARPGSRCEQDPRETERFTRMGGGVVSLPPCPRAEEDRGWRACWGHTGIGPAGLSLAPLPGDSGRAFLEGQCAPSVMACPHTVPGRQPGATSPRIPPGSSLCQGLCCCAGPGAHAHRSPSGRPRPEPPGWRACASLICHAPWPRPRMVYRAERRVIAGSGDSRPQGRRRSPRGP